MKGCIILVECEPRPWPKKRIITKIKRGNILVQLKFPKLTPWFEKPEHRARWNRWTNAIKTEIKLHMLQHDIAMYPKGTPIALGFVIVSERPPSVSFRKRWYPVVKPDFDNYLYGIVNTLKGLLFEDDDQIVASLPSLGIYNDPQVMDAWNLPRQGVLINAQPIQLEPRQALSDLMDSWSFFTAYNRAEQAEMAL